MLKLGILVFVGASCLFGSRLHANCRFVLHQMGMHKNSGVTDAITLHSLGDPAGIREVGPFSTYLAHTDYHLVFPEAGDPRVVGWAPRIPFRARTAQQSYFSHARDGELYEIGSSGEIQLVPAQHTDRPVLVRAADDHLYYQGVSGAFYALSLNRGGPWKNEQWLAPGAPIRNLTGDIGNVVSFDVRSRTPQKLELVILTEKRLLSLELTRTPSGDAGPATCLGDYLVAQGTLSVQPMWSEVLARGEHVWVRLLVNGTYQNPYYFSLDPQGAFSPVPPFVLPFPLAMQYGAQRHWALYVDPITGALHENREYGDLVTIVPPTQSNVAPRIEWIVVLKPLIFSA